MVIQPTLTSARAADLLRVGLRGVRHGGRVVHDAVCVSPPVDVVARGLRSLWANGLWRRRWLQRDGDAGGVLALQLQPFLRERLTLGREPALCLELLVEHRLALSRDPALVLDLHLELLTRLLSTLTEPGYPVPRVDSDVAALWQRLRAPAG